MRKLTSFILTLCMLLTLFVPLATMSVSAATTPATVSVTEAKARIEILKNALNGKFFTVNQSYCDTNDSRHSCSNCLMSSVISQGWLQNLGLMVPDSYTYCPTQYDPADGKPWSVDGYSCFGFANYAHWFIFAQKSSDKLTTQLITTGLFSYETLNAYARPGDVLRTPGAGHSMVLISFDQYGAMVMDCNEYTLEPNNYNCRVQVYYKKFADYKRTVSINSVANYNRTLCSHTDSTGKSLFDGKGICTSCEYQFPFNTQRDTSYAGLYKVKSGQTAKVRPGPYEDYTEVLTTTSGTFKVLARVYNAKKPLLV